MEPAVHDGGVLGKSVQATAKSLAKSRAKSGAGSEENKSSISTDCSSASTRRPRVGDDAVILDLLPVPQAKRARSTTAVEGESVERADCILRLGKVKNVMPPAQWTYPPGVQMPNWVDKILVCIERLQALPRLDMVVNTWSDCARASGAHSTRDSETARRC